MGLFPLLIRPPYYRAFSVFDSLSFCANQRTPHTFPNDPEGGGNNVLLRTTKTFIFT